MFILVNKDGEPVPGFEQYASESLEETRNKIGRTLFITWDMKAKAEQYLLITSSLSRLGWKLVAIKRVTPEKQG